MDVIKITPEELRITAAELRDAALFLSRGFVGEGVKLKAESLRIIAEKYSALADKLDADKLDAMTFCAAKVEGVQA